MSTSETLEEKVRQLGCTMLVSEDTDLTAKDLSGGIGERSEERL